MFAIHTPPGRGQNHKSCDRSIKSLLLSMSSYCAIVLMAIDATTGGWFLPIFNGFWKTLVYAAVIRISLLTAISNFASVWPPNGLFVGLWLTSTRRESYFLVPFMILALLLVNIEQNSLLAAVIFTVINIVESCICFVMIVCLAPNNKYRDFCNLKTCGIIIVSSVVSSLIGGCLGAWFILSYYQLPSFLFSVTCVKWFSSDGIGLIQMIPLLLSIMPISQSVKTLGANVGKSIFALFCIIAIVSVEVFLHNAPIDQKILPPEIVPFIAHIICMPIVLATGYLVGHIGFTASSLALSISAVIGIVNSGYSNEDGTTQMFRLQFFLIVLMICSMVVMVLHEERKESMEKVIKASVQKTAFMAFLCHELRNPLHALINVSSLVQETLTLNSDQRELFDAIQASASYMSELINDVLDTSLFESGQMKLADPMPVLRGGINELVEAVVAPFRDGIHGRGIELNCEIKEGLNDLTSTRMLCMDVMKVKQVIVNLLSNAIKFTDKGGKISCTFEIGAIGSGLAGFPHGKQKLSLNRNQMSSAVHGNKIGDGWVLLKFSISDSGIGMTEETLKNLFIPFLPSTMATTREYGGTGLGLVICKKIVDLMEGKIFVKSAQNEGTTFTVEIPVRLASGKEHIWEESEGAKSVRFGIETITPDTEKFLPPPPPLPQIPPEVLIEVRETHPTTSLQRVEQKLRESQSRMSLSRLSSPSPYPEDSFQTDEKFRLSCSLKRPGTMLMHVTSPINDANGNFQEQGGRLSLSNASLTRKITVVRSGNLDVIKSGVSNTSTLHFGTSHNASGSISPQNLNDSGIGPKNILVVDDSGINRKIIVKFLRTINAKFRIDEAVNGLEAVEKASLSQYDIIFMDLTMPVMGGREATRQIKQELKVPAPVIAVTGDNLPTEELDKLFEIGFTAVQPKPFTKEKIEKYFQCIKNNP